MVLVLVQGDPAIHVLDASGDVKHRLEGHKAPVISACWLAGDAIASIDTAGEIRAWLMRGSKVDCTRVRDVADSPVGVAPWPARQRGIQRFVAWSAGGTVHLVEQGVVNGKARFDAPVLAAAPVAGADPVHVLVSSGRQATVHELAPGMSARVVASLDDPRWDGAASAVIVPGAAVLATGASGDVLSVPLVQGKLHELRPGTTVTAVAADAVSRTAVLGTRSGSILAWACRNDWSFIDRLVSIDVHDFSITAIDVHPSGLVACGTLDGMFKLFKAPPGFLQARQQPATPRDPGWQDVERVENKLAQTRACLSRGDHGKAREVLDGVEALKIPGFDQAIREIDAGIKDLEVKKAAEASMKDRVVGFLRGVARERGDILLDEIASALGISKNRLKPLVKEMSTSMAWEYVDQHECLFLFERIPQITREVRLPAAPGRRHDGPPPRGPPGRRQGPPHRHETPFRDRHAPRPAGPGIDSRIASLLAREVPAVDGSMKASAYNAKNKCIATVPLGELSAYLDTPTARDAGITVLVTDGIVSPRLAMQARALGIVAIAGKRLHPNLDATGAGPPRCVEFDAVLAISGDVEAGSATGGEDIRGSILDLLDRETWVPEREVLERLALPGEVEAGLARVKLKQLAAAGDVLAEFHAGERFYRKARDKS